MRKPLTSTRKPILRVVGAPRETARHARLYTIAASDYVVEFWSDAEWLALPEWERHPGAALVPGGGRMIVRFAISEAEKLDIASVQNQTDDEARLMAGQM